MRNFRLALIAVFIASASYSQVGPGSRAGAGGITLAGKVLVSGGAVTVPIFVQSCFLDPGFGNTNQITCTFSSPVASGDAVLCAAFWGVASQTISSVSDGTNTYVLNIDNPTGNGTSAGSFYTLNATGSPTIVTVTFPTTVNTPHAVVCHEVQNLKTSAAIDGHNGQYQVSPGHGTDAISSGTFTTTANNDYIFAAMVDTNGQNDPTVAGTNFTLRVSSAIVTLRSEDQVQLTAGAGTAGTFTDTGTGFPDPLTVAMAFEHP